MAGIEVHSAGGRFTARADGTRVKWRPFKSAKGDDEYEEYARIVRFDLDEYRKHYPNGASETAFDVLDLGHWLDDGTYEPADAGFRKWYAAELAWHAENDRKTKGAN